MNRIRGERREEIQMPIQVPNDLHEWKATELNDVADECGKKFAGITPNQIRNVFSEVKRIQLEWKKGKKYDDAERGLVLLKPRLAYAAGRKKSVTPFKEVLGKAIDGVINSTEHEKALENFFSFVEAIVAYHKYYHEGRR